MKFESLNNSKFDSFKANQILDSFSKITGGSGGTATTYKSGSSSGTDCLDTSTKGTGSTIDGEEVDYNRGSCP